MTPLRRYNLTGHTYFITVVTCKRQRILLKDPELFHKSWRKTIPLAWVILPNHFHAILEVGECSISEALHSFKITYSRRYRNERGPGRVWQNRFWDHVIRNQRDLNQHVDYIHYNPVSHGIAASPGDYAPSSFSRYVENGTYDSNWGDKETPEFTGDYGE